MGFLDSVDLNNAVENTAVPGGEEYKLRIVDIKTDLSNSDNLPRNKNGDAYLLPRFEIIGEPTAKEFNRYMVLPGAEADEKQKNNASFKIKLFLETFNLDPNSLEDPSDIIGAEGWAILGFEETDDWGEQNFVKKFIAPK
jgi:hypothetical protein